MFKYDVFVNGRWIGTLIEDSEELARCAARSKFVIPANAELTVFQRDA